jgi:hypothetical protein
MYTQDQRVVGGGNAYHLVLGRAHEAVDVLEEGVTVAVHKVDARVDDGPGEVDHHEVVVVGEAV